MRSSLIFFFLVLAACTAFADPVITSISPDSGPVMGGTVVTIKGTGFSNTCIVCLPPFANPIVYFGSTQATSVRFIDPTTVEATTPPHLPTTVTIVLQQFDGSQNPGFFNGFSFEGDPEPAFEPVLFPLLSRPIMGAFDSEFRTRARISGNGGDSDTWVYGQDRVCTLIDPPLGPFDPIILGPDSQDADFSSFCSDVTGRVAWIRKGNGLAANLRVADVTREATSHGTEIPVVRESEFRNGRIVLLGVPYDERFRSTLRIYSLKPTTQVINVEIGGFGRQIHLQPGENIFEPSMAVISDFPRREDIDPIHFRDRVVILPADVPLWAFVSVTNNETQQITTITPN